MLKYMDDNWTKGTYIDFRNMGKYGKKKTNTYEVWGKTDILGYVEWFARWRQYTFSPNEDTTYNPTCLQEIAEFCQQKTKVHKEGFNA